MGVMVAFVAGWVLGSRAGDTGYDEIVHALRDIRDSEEFATLVAALRSHSGVLLRQVADWLQQADGPPMQAAEFIERVRGLVEPRPTSGEG